MNTHPGLLTYENAEFAINKLAVLERLRVNAERTGVASVRIGGTVYIVDCYDETRGDFRLAIMENVHNDMGLETFRGALSEAIHETRLSLGLTKDFKPTPQDLHDTLLDAVALVPALAAVVELHKPVERVTATVCTGCDRPVRAVAGAGYPSWPCATVRTIADHVGVEVEK